jgi:predicted dinucleotide-binding enzyme
VVIDTSNYYAARDGRIDAIENGQVASLWVADQSGRPVKAWNAIGSDSFARKGRASLRGSPDRIALPVAADADRNRKVGVTLVEDTGFYAFDAGTLAES